MPETFSDRLADCGNISGEWPLSSFVAHAETIATMYECLDQSWEPLRKLHDILLGPGKRRAINKTTLAKETGMDRRQIAPALYLLSNLILHRDRNLRASLELGVERNTDSEDRLVYVDANAEDETPMQVVHRRKTSRLHAETVFSEAHGTLMALQTKHIDGAIVPFAGGRIAAYTGSTNLKRGANLLQSINQFGMIFRRKKTTRYTFL